MRVMIIHVWITVLSIVLIIFIWHCPRHRYEFCNESAQWLRPVSVFVGLYCWKWACAVPPSPVFNLGSVQWRSLSPREAFPPYVFLFGKFIVGSVSVAYGEPISHCLLVSKTIGNESESGWQKRKAWFQSAKHALACEMKGWTLERVGRREGRGQGGDGTEHGRTGQEQRRSAVSTMHTGCQVDCRVSCREWLLWASGCFGVHIKRKGMQTWKNNSFPPLSHISFTSPKQNFFPLSYRRLSCFLSHESFIRGGAGSLSSGGETARLQGCHGKVWERPRRGQERTDVDFSGGQHSHTWPLLYPDIAFSTENTTWESFFQHHKPKQKYHLVPFLSPSTVPLFRLCTAVSTASITFCSLCL